jgi:hypothetical protein
MRWRILLLAKIVDLAVFGLHFGRVHHKNFTRQSNCAPLGAGLLNRTTV